MRDDFQLKLKSFVARKVHNLYDFDIKFNPDVNILYGINGCGKTTVLKLISIIISGNFYDLRSYRFVSLCLRFYSEEKDYFIQIENTDGTNQERVMNVRTNHPDINEIIPKLKSTSPSNTEKRIKRYTQINSQFKKV